MAIVDVRGGNALDLRGELRVYTLYDIFRGLIDIDFPEFFIQFCNAIFILDAGVTGDTRGHTFEWEIISGRTDNVVYLTSLFQPIASYEIVPVGAETSPVFSDRVWRFWVDRGTEIEQFFDLTIYGTPISEVHPTTILRSVKEAEITDFLVTLIKLLTKTETDEAYPTTFVGSNDSEITDYLAVLIKLLTKTETSNVYSSTITSTPVGGVTFLSSIVERPLNYSLKLIKGYQNTYYANGVSGCGANTDYSLHWFPTEGNRQDAIVHSNVRRYYDVDEFRIQSTLDGNNWNTVIVLEGDVSNYTAPLDINTTYRVLAVIKSGGSDLVFETNTVYTSNTGTIRRTGLPGHAGDSGLTISFSSQVNGNVVNYEVANLSQGGIGG